MKKKTEKGSPPRLPVCPRWGWGLLSGVGGGGQAGRDSSARAKSSKSLEKPGLGNQKCTLRGGSENLDKAGFWLPWACFSLLGEGGLAFPASSGGLNGFAPHPRAGSSTGAASELGCTLLPYKTVPPFSLPFLLLTTNRERWSGIWPTGSLPLALNTILLQAHLPSPSWHRMKWGRDRGTEGDRLFSLVQLEIVYFHPLQGIGNKNPSL